MGLKHFTFSYKTQVEAAKKVVCMFARKAYDKLVEWKRVSNGKTAVMIEGARRVGKSTVAEAFAKVEYRDYLMLDFSVESEAVKRNFAENIGDLDAFFRNLFLLKGKSLPRGESVVVFDEVQLFPLARQAIKQLVKDGRYHYIETGSLISIRENSGSILIPSEEYQIRMHPMDFEEFLWAKGDTVTADAIREAFAAKKPLGTDIHRKIMGDFRMYMAVGGMPQAVAEYVAGGTFEEIDFAKRAILSLYDEDIRKYDNAENGRVSAIYRSVPDQLGNRNMRFKYAAIDKNARYDRLVSSLDFLSESMIVNVCTNVTAPDALMELHVQKENFKMFMADTGCLWRARWGRRPRWANRFTGLWCSTSWMRIWAWSWRTWSRRCLWRRGIPCTFTSSNAAPRLRSLSRKSRPRSTRWTSCCFGARGSARWR